jgi:CheY-like chemotaxis protein
MKKDNAPAARILLVDDNSHGLIARRMILVDHGYGVETALSGEEAWEIFQKSHFDIVVTDLRMSGIDGVELIRRIRASDAPARTILLSGFIGCLGLTEQSTGADELIAKSNKEVPELLRAIRKLATQPRRRRASSQGGGGGSASSSGQGPGGKGPNDSDAMRAG